LARGDTIPSHKNQISGLFIGERVTPSRTKWTRWLLSAGKVILCALLCWFIYVAFAGGNEKLEGLVWHIEPEWLVLSGFLYLLGVFPAAVYWYFVLHRTGQDVKFGESMRAYYISQLGKYVPGKWMVILLRRTLLHSPGAETTVVAASVFFETLTLLAVGSAMAALALVAWHPNQTILILTAVGSTLLLGVPTVPAVFEWLIRALGVGKLNPTAGARFRQIEWPVIVAGWIGIALGWFLQGMALWAVLRGLGATTEGPFYELSLHTTAVALGVVAGFLSQIPGGLVMREWVSGALIGPHYGEAMGMISAVIFRLVLLVSELSISIILYGAGLRRFRGSVGAISAELSASGQR
jgi:glycosyltransferase 2 family protein